MMVQRLAKWTAVGGLTLGLMLLAAAPDLIAGPSPKDVDKYTTQLKTSKDPKVKATALAELGKLGQIQKSLVEPAFSSMKAALDDKDPIVRGAAAKAVGMVDPDPKEVLPTLIKLAKEDKDESVRLAAIAGLGSMGENAKEAVKDLRDIMSKEDKKSKLNKAAGDALKSINPKKK